MTRSGERGHILFATIGSLGDLHPCIAMARELILRGYRVTIASTPYYRARVEALGIGFHPIRPNWDPTDHELIRKCENLRKGPEVLYRELILPRLRETYDDLLSAARGADLMIAGELVYAAPLVAEKTGMPWASLILSPFSFFSSFDPSVMVNAPQLIHLRKLGPSAYRMGLNIGRLATRHWSNPVRELRRELGLRRACDPVFRDKFSPDLVLALFSRYLCEPQRDWPPQTLQTGFLYFDDPGGESDVQKYVSDFLAGGEAPLVFAQGSTAAHHAGEFYEISLAAAKRLGRRAIAIGMGSTAKLSSSDLLMLPYAPYSEVFPHASVIVHQGGSGTTGQALRSGRPMLVVPYGWDQPDNAARVERLGVGLHVPRKAYSVGMATTALKRLLESQRVGARAAEIAARLRDEDGLKGACEAIGSVVG